MSNARRLAKLTAIFLGGSAASKLLVFLLLPVYTRVLPTAEYGYFDVTVTYVTVIAALLYVDVWVGAMRIMYMRDERAQRIGAARAGLLLIASSTAALFSVGAIVGLIADVRYLWLIVAYAASSCVREYYGYVARGLSMNAAFSVSGIVNTVVAVSLNLFLLLVLEWGISSLYVAFIVGNLTQVIWLEFRSRLLTSRWDPIKLADLRVILWFALPLGINSAAFWLLTGWGKIVVQLQLSLSDNGLYAVGSKFGAIIVVLAGALIMAWQDILFSHKGEAAERVYRSSARYFVLLSALGIAVCLPSISSVFPLLVGDSYRAVFDLVPGFALSATLGALNSMLGNVFYSIHRTFAVLWTTLLACVIALALTSPLVHLAGINGANAALCLGFGASIATRAYLLKRAVGFSFGAQDVAVAIFVTAVSMAAFGLLPAWGAIAVSLVLLLAVALLYRRDLGRALRG